MKMNEKKFTVLITLFLFVLTMFFSVFLSLLKANMSILEIQNGVLISENLRLQTEIIQFQEEIKVASQKAVPAFVDASVSWKDILVKVTCVTCILVALVATPAFFAATPYMFCYSSSDWYCHILASWFPIEWLKTAAPIKISDTVNNEYLIVFNTALDTFTMYAKIVGSNNYSSIANFLQVLLNFHDK